MIETPQLLKPLTVQPPTIDEQQAAWIAEHEFGKQGSATEIGGERDQNFRVDVDEDEAYVLKISSPADDVGSLDLQTEALHHVNRIDPDLPIMEPVPTLDGSFWTSIDVGETYYVRMFTHVSGHPVSGSELDDEVLYDYGSVVARLGKALRSFFHPNADYDIVWDLRHTSELRPLLDSVTDPERRALAERILNRFENRVAPDFESLRMQVIHNDLTLDNVLMDEQNRVTGIVDFGDLTHTALVSDLVMAVASVMYRHENPIEAAQAVIRGYVSITPLEDEERNLLVDLVASRLLAWGVTVAWRIEEHPEKIDDHSAAGVDGGWALLQSLEEDGLDNVGRCLRTASLSSNVPYPQMEQSRLCSRRSTVLGESPLFYEDPVHVVGGESVWLFDSDGQRYLDAYNNVQVVGHTNSAVADAIGGQARKLTTHTRYLHEAPVRLAERLLATMPDKLDRVLFVNSGSEATDVAWRLAKAATGNNGAIVSENAYHGITDAVAEQSSTIWPESFSPEHVETIEPPVDERFHRSNSNSEPVKDMTESLDSLERQGLGTAAFMFDSLFTSDGIYPPDKIQLGKMTDRVREAGGLVIADEVQTGHGRCGSDLWGFQSTDIVPDIVTIGKPMGNGHPVAAVVTQSDIASTLYDQMGFFSTFGGNPVSCAAALAVLDQIQQRDLLTHVSAVGEYLKESLEELAADYELIGEVRQRGLMIGIEIVKDQDSWEPAPRQTTAVVNGLRQRQVLIGSSGKNDNVLKIRPPLIFEKGHVDHLLERLNEVLSEQ
ncbi:aminotransferase class III-fold pyridoxal phosphate-dependent enzyme [Halomicroarcula limicola]|uniref:Aminotransferase class III-fold pyridoxal phosphate-dependent enzyme n=1 Tax=Haloarcula limicola TaxID=1429915 RepID=A0A8J8C5H2_9EURY|nr:aminotransferase class III-fold pyridoxal phosphate-dependent enzyme [Halomicroarcula limicola]MBV0926322.1 aminotransferase class III-fold pyridoxal phosphate-dependent enzyme [Halomicroarcula limicola]